MFILIVVWMLAVLSAGYFLRMAIEEKKKPKAISAANKKDRSWPAKKLLKKNELLPPDSRIADLESVVDALDIKYGGKEAINYHFLDNKGYGSIEVNAWQHDRSKNYRCSTSTCPMNEYRTLKDSMDEVITAYQEQKNAFALESVKHDANRVAEITAHLRSEREIVDSVTKEITGG